ncbi:MAG: pilin [Patescibacteria group bacterium]|nr:pilin [Patescibacteria group bacterium]
MNVLALAAKLEIGDIKNPTEYGDDTTALGNLITNAASSIVMIAGVLLFGMLIFGGFLWLTAQGDEDQVEKAQKVLSSAVIGLVIVVAAFFITQILGTVLGFGSIFELEFPTP